MVQVGGSVTCIMSMSRDLAEWGWSKADFQWADEAQKVANSERGGGGGGAGVDPAF